MLGETFSERSLVFGVIFIKLNVLSCGFLLSICRVTRQKDVHQKVIVLLFFHLIQFISFKKITLKHFFTKKEGHEENENVEISGSSSIKFRDSCAFHPLHLTPGIRLVLLTKNFILPYCILTLKKSRNIAKTVCNIMLIPIAHTELK